MSEAHLLHSRLCSQRTSPSSLPLPNGISGPLTPQSRDSHQLFKTQILNISSNDRATELKPLPKMDYHLLYLLINLVRPYLSTRDLQPYDYLTEARKWYFIGHSKSQEAIIELLATYTHAQILDLQFNELVQILDNQPTANLQPSFSGFPPIEPLSMYQKLATLELARRRNNELSSHLLNVQRKAKVRDHATAWLSSLKWKSLQDGMPGLVEMGKQIHVWKIGKRGYVSYFRFLFFGFFIV